MGDLSGVFWPLDGGFGVAAVAVLGVAEDVDAQRPDGKGYA